MSNLRNKIALEFGVHGQRNIDEQGLKEILAIIEKYPKTMGVYSEFNSNSRKHEQK